MTGRIVISRAGHDKGSIYVVISCNGGLLSLADGRLKRTDNPKRKNRKHVQLTNCSVDRELLEAIQNGVPHLDDRIKYAVKCYRKLITDTNS